MKLILFLLTLFLGSTINGQPFRFSPTNNDDRDSIKAHAIKGYKEFVEDSLGNLSLIKIVAYDDNGNLIRECRIDTILKTQNQWTYQFDAQNRQLVETIYFPDSSTIQYRFINEYDSLGNISKYKNQNFKNGAFYEERDRIYSYDSLNRKIEAKIYGTSGQLTDHFQYSYESSGLIKEISFDPVTGEKTFEIYKNLRLFSFIETENALPNLENLQEQHRLDSMNKIEIRYNPINQTTEYENAESIWIFNERKEMIVWYEKKYRKHLFEYTYY